MASTTPASPNLLDILLHYGIFDSVCSNFDIKDLLAMRLVSKTLSVNYSAHRNARWDVNRYLRRFVRDPRSLRSLMARKNAVIAGSFVIQFLDGVLWPATSLDILVRREDDHDDNPPTIGVEGLDLNKDRDISVNLTADFGKHLCETEGYEKTRDVKESEFTHLPRLGVNRVGRWAGVDRYEDYVRAETETTPEAKICIMFTRGDPVEHILKYNRATQVMNFITWNKAYSLFPDITFLKPREQHRLQNRDYLSAKFLDRYEQRGWKVANTIRPSERFPPSIYPTRRIGDARCWTVALNTDGVEAAEIPDFVLELGQFDLKLEFGYIKVSAYLIDYPSFKYQYIVGLEAYDKNFWVHYVSEKMQDLNGVELKKWEVTEKRESLRQLFKAECGWISWASGGGGNRRRPEKVPETWTFYDHLLPGWHEEWQKQCKLNESANGPSVLVFGDRGVRKLPR
ncbi:hypothetical protein BKA65DRAFT_474646 [Rhexocercosporidium sp. MPI-PUGE-AT-0058]|nr:hypothetical protein BKA65DRAFT_474646 [Rhexocercosporidium sp. MPI-PUGE-AT-0058]